MNITYLFGAGASANALPCVDKLSIGFTDFKQSIAERRQYLKHFTVEHMPELADDFDKSVEAIITDLTWLIDELQRQSSIDTFAKKLYFLENINELTKLKSLLTIYFSFIQHTYLDKRYDNFIASILGTDVNDLPQNLKLLSWNYDFQFEKSYSQFIHKGDLSSSKERLNLQFHTDSECKPTNKFAIFKLNGTVGYLNDAGKFVYITYNIEEKKRVVKTIIQYSTLTSRLVQLGVSFAWEAKSQVFLQAIAEAVKDTNILVVIGYSFPYFNRAIDRQVIRDGMPKLHKVYIQSHPNDISDVKERFMAIREDGLQIVLRTDLNQFTFPNEL